MRNSYWSCSAFADWLRGTAKLDVGTSEQWHHWRCQAQQSHPWRYWLVEHGLDYVQDFITWPVRKLYDIKYYINNRFVTRTHQLTAHIRDIRPGHWCDLGDRFVPCLFNELVDFVEIELAWWHIAWASPEDRAQYDPPWWATGWFRWRTWRCAQAGLDNLEWQRNLRWQEHEVHDAASVGQLTPQAVNAQEILDLYTWWTQQRPARPDPMEASGWSAYCEQRREQEDGHWLGDRNHDVTGPMLDQMHALEQSYRDQDDAMLIRLIRVRGALWT